MKSYVLYKSEETTLQLILSRISILAGTQSYVPYEIKIRIGGFEKWKSRVPFPQIIETNDITIGDMDYLGVLPTTFEQLIPALCSLLPAEKDFAADSSAYLINVAYLREQDNKTYRDELTIGHQRISCDFYETRISDATGKKFVEEISGRTGFDASLKHNGIICRFSDNASSESIATAAQRMLEIFNCKSIVNLSWRGYSHGEETPELYNDITGLRLPAESYSLSLAIRFHNLEDLSTMQPLCVVANESFVYAVGKMHFAKQKIGVTVIVSPTGYYLVLVCTKPIASYKLSADVLKTLTDLGFNLTTSYRDFK